MTVTNCVWLPEIVNLNNYNNDPTAYFNYLYNVFMNDLVLNKPKFKGLYVAARKYPMKDGRHEGFYHLTSRDYDKTGYENRILDLRRCERIHWIKPVILNYQCYGLCCSHIKTWKEKNRYYILFEEERYIVVMDQRKGYFVVVTAYYVDYNHALAKLLKRYNNAKSVHSSTL